MNDQQQIQTMQEFIKSHELAVLSTVNQLGKPESAVIGFSIDDEFKIYFGTFSTARKYSNLQTNTAVSMVIGWEKGRTVQIDGVAREITEPKEIDQTIINHLSKIPSVAKFLERPDERLFEVSPSVIRYSDLSVDPWETFEIKL